MTQEMQDKIRKVAEYVQGKAQANYLIENYGIDRFEPLSSQIAALYPVAKRVKAELMEAGLYKAAFAIKRANNEFDVLALFQSVHDGIVLLEQHNSITK